MKWPPAIPKSFPRVWVDFFTTLIQKITDNEPRDGRGIRCVPATGGGKSVNLWGAAGGSPGGSGAFIHAFKILLRTNELGTFRGVTGNCYLFPIPGEGEALEDFVPVEIHGTLTGDEGSGSEDEGWKPTEDGDEIWIEVAFDPWPFTYTVAIKSKKVDGNIFSSGRVEHDGGSEGDPPEYIQTRARVLIGRVEDISEEEGKIELVVRQFLTTNLVLESTLTDGKAADGGDKKPVDCLVMSPYC